MISNNRNYQITQSYNITVLPLYDMKNISHAIPAKKVAQERKISETKI